MSDTHYEVIIIGGGHAGTEAALASARKGARTLLLTHNIDTLGQMSCNPAIGGIGKGHLVKEIDAMGGAMAEAIDEAGIQFRVLNRRKGPAVRATRAQADRELYKRSIRNRLESQKNLLIFQSTVSDLIVENDQAKGVRTSTGLSFYAPAIVLTTGTFLGGKIHIGGQQQEGGRAGERASNALADRLRALPFRVGRLKTGTPPRIDIRSIDFSQMGVQPGDTPVPVFSFMKTAKAHPEQINCHMTYTTERTHDIIRDNLHLSAMYSGNIEGVGPRYCPSIEDKVVRFAEKGSHQIFVEPEGLNSLECYPNGISTSLPFDIQQQFVRSITGFENAHITRPGYAIEYDYFDPRDLKPSLETKLIGGLFFAGQINGTTGYEEAGAQGLVAGLNAACLAQDVEPWLPERTNSYIGVLIDDLITCGTQEPYRMFTSRAEHRLLLREDNADQRLTPIAQKFGIISEARWTTFQNKMSLVEQEVQRFKNTFVQTGTETANALNALIPKPITHEYSLLDLLKRPELEYTTLASLPNCGPVLEHQDVREQVEIQAKYAGYISRQNEDILRDKQHLSKTIPINFDYDRVKGLSNEVLQKLKDTCPTTVGEASRIPGVTPAAISLLLIFLKKLATHSVT